MVTIREIAEKSGVSIATVSNIINNKGKASPETVERVRKVIEEMNYVPNAVARNLKSKRSKSIGVIVEDMTIFSIPDILDGITDYCDRHNYQVFLVNLRLFMNYNDTYYNKNFYYEKVHKEILKLVNLQVEGIIYVSAHEREIPVFPEDMNLPAVMAYGYSKRNDIPSVVVDDRNGMSQITECVMKAGHKKIGLITGKRDSMHAQARLIGFEETLFRHGGVMEPELIQIGDWERKSGYESTDILLKQGVTVIMCMNDLMAGGVYDRLEERGLVPGRDVSVTGYDDRQLSAYYRPALTTVRLPLHDIGYKAGEVLLKMLDDHYNDNPKTDLELRSDKHDIYEVPCKLELRKSLVKPQ
ncbi:MAG: LacI family DNA-binding transcriptional regulator [Lachnospiraceae bacterium]|nr:LacI family DNA-binding transcriptional regulator [Lachnospiraceae bacterium]MDD6449088.1 LacI family DNA-binding transcriptional regulator [Lachnospiraceae bacterium]MDD6451118.1 LacI family DNA-binding transcriptional regulator [Lachnospiraceae bacterium]MDD6579008.1 LacI family DNA-binding transcriptional regulator [Lachnospiraceae bacterium]